MSPTSSHGGGASASRSDASIAGFSSLLTSVATVAKADGAGVAGALDGTTGTTPADAAVAGDVSAAGSGVAFAEGAAPAGVGDGQRHEDGEQRRRFGPAA